MKLLLLGLGTQEIILLAIVALLFFGGKKIPELMKGVGKGVRSFKDGLNGKDDETTNDAEKNDKTNA
ncbi:MAG: twin-arginine translocase TatA/TatE family subunit [Bacteroidales bacterium]|nr:twin-arginine translocase TatA/TatE family subunit [Bacteroidales bacterium]